MNPEFVLSGHILIHIHSYSYRVRLVRALRETLLGAYLQNVVGFDFYPKLHVVDAKLLETSGILTLTAESVTEGPGSVMSRSRLPPENLLTPHDKDA